MLQPLADLTWGTLRALLCSAEVLIDLGFLSDRLRERREAKHAFSEADRQLVIELSHHMQRRLPCPAVPLCRCRWYPNPGPLFQLV